LQSQQLKNKKSALQKNKTFADARATTRPRTFVPSNSGLLDNGLLITWKEKGYFANKAAKNMAG